MIGDYCLGRFLRIYPLYCLAVLLYYYCGFTRISTTGDIINALTLRQGYAHLWTVPVEFKFYFILPFLSWCFNKVAMSFGNSGLLILCLLGGLGNQALAPYWLIEPHSISTFFYLPTFLFGAAAACFRFDHQAVWFTRASTPLSLLILLLMVLSTPPLQLYLGGAGVHIGLSDKYLYFSLGWAIFIFFQVHSSSFIGRVLSGKFLTISGHYSYPLYLIHWLIFNLFAVWRRQGLLALPEAVVGALVTSFVLAAFLHYTCEKPLYALRVWLGTWKIPKYRFW